MTSQTYTGFANAEDASDEVDSLRFMMRQMLNSMATATLVKVAAVDVAAGTVDVQPMVRQIDGAGNAINHGTIHDMPYFVQRAGTAAVVIKPLPGDIGVAVFCHSDISSVKETRMPANPSTWRRFDWGDGLYIGGFIGDEPTTLIEVDDLNGVTITVPTDKHITLNGNVQVNGDMMATGTITGETDVVAAGISGKGHKHGGITRGTGTSDTPV